MTSEAVGAHDEISDGLSGPRAQPARHPASLARLRSSHPAAALDATRDAQRAGGTPALACDVQHPRVDRPIPPLISSRALADAVVHRELRTGDPEAIVALHDRVYGAEYGLDERFAPSVARSLEAAMARGWPSSGGAVWLVDRGGELRGSLGLTDEGSGRGRVRWFVLAPELRGRGLGRSLVAELVAEARASGLQRLELETFSALAAAAHLYREAGFRVESLRETDQWGPPIIYQRYALELR